MAQLTGTVLLSLVLVFNFSANSRIQMGLPDPLSATAQTPPQIVRMDGPREGDTPATYPEADGTALLNPYVLVAGGNTLTFDDGGTVTCGSCSEPPLIIYRQCEVAMPFPTNAQSKYVPSVYIDCATGKWKGNFSPGTKVLAQNGLYLDITLANPVSEVGFQAQVSWYTRQDFTVTAFNGSTQIGSIVVDDANGAWASTPFANGLALFVGVRATCGSVITRIRVVASDRFSPSRFGIGPVYFGSYSVTIPPIPPTQ